MSRVDTTFSRHTRNCSPKWPWGFHTRQVYAEGYGRITWKRPNALGGHYFRDPAVRRDREFCKLNFWDRDEKFGPKNRNRHEIFFSNPTFRHWHSKLPFNPFNLPSNGLDFVVKLLVVSDLCIDFSDIYGLYGTGWESRPRRDYRFHYYEKIIRGVKRIALLSQIFIKWKIHKTTFELSIQQLLW